MITRISFNSIVPPNSATHLLAFRVLKGYLDHQGMGRHFHILFNLFKTDTGCEEIAQEIIDQNVAVAAFSTYLWNASMIGRICERIKQTDIELLTVLGGPQATITADRLIRESPIDLIIKGPGEDVFCSVLDHVRKKSDDWHHIPNLVYRHNGRVVKTESDLSSDVRCQDYPIPVEEGNSPFFFYETSRGCPFKCRFCAWETDRKRRVRFYPKPKIENDLKAIFNLPHVRFLSLCDSDPFLNRRHGTWVLGTIRKLNARRKARRWPEIIPSFEINPEFVDDAVIDEIGKLPMSVNTIECGLQTVDEHLNNRVLKRKFNKDLYFKNFKKLRKCAKDRVSLSIIYGLPGDTYAGFRKTVDTIFSELKTRHFIGYRFNVLPGSYFWEHAEDYRLIFEKDPPHRIISSDTFSEEDILKAGRLTFFLYLFSTVLKGIMRVVEKNVPHNQLRVYDEIIQHISDHYPAFVSPLYDNFVKEGDFEFVFRLGAYLTDKRYVGQRYDIIRDARGIVQRRQSPAGSGSIH
jgi:anaerobic magnesium-protoporphyrin IX monomethyl ester cyclase